MKTLMIVSKGSQNLPLETVRELERLDLHPRTRYLDERLQADLLDEAWMSRRHPILRWMYARLPFHIAQIVEAIRVKGRYDVIFSLSERAALPLANILGLLDPRKPHVVMIWRITSDDPGQARMKMSLLRRGWRSVDAFVVWSSRQARIMWEECGVDRDRIHWFRYGVDDQFWRPMKAVQNRICSVGMEMRDYPTLVEALRGTSIRCHIATGMARGELFDTVRRLYDVKNLPEGITIGQLDYQDLRRLYAASRFVVIPLLPTDSDNGLTAIVEAMAMGRTVICSQVEGQVDLIRDGVNGLLVPQGDPQALREAILSLWNDPERAARMGREARDTILARHGLEQSMERVIDLVHATVRLGRERGVQRTMNSIMAEERQNR